MEKRKLEGDGGGLRWAWGVGWGGASLKKKSNMYGRIENL